MIDQQTADRLIAEALNHREEPGDRELALTFAVHALGVLEEFPKGNLGRQEVKNLAETTIRALCR